MKVFKFGGVSISSASHIRNVVKIVKKHSPDVVVFSAMGKMTNHFEQLLTAVVKNTSDVEDLFRQIKMYHFEIIADLFDVEHDVYQKIDAIFEDLKTTLSNIQVNDVNKAYGQIVPYGEWLSVNIMSEYLKQQDFANDLVHAKNWLVTDNNYRNAQVDEAKSQANLLQFKTENPLITQGFVGACNGETTTLGREGSDYTASLIAAFFNAENLTIWKDVEGLLNADPKYFSDTQTLPQISYDEAIELAFYGAKVIHPKTIKPLQNKGIPLYIKSFENELIDGTVIRFEKDFDKDITSYILKKNQMLLTLKTKDFSFMSDPLLQQIYSVLYDMNLTVSLMQRSAITISLCTDYEKEKLEKLLDILKLQYKIRYNENVELLTIRNYTEVCLNSILKNREILIEQRSRINAQYVLK